MPANILLCLKNYFKKTFFCSEIIVIATFFYIFIFKASPYTFAHDTFIIQLNAAVVFSGLLVAYRIFVYEIPEVVSFLNFGTRKSYYFSRLFVVLLINTIVIAVIYLLLYFYKGSSIDGFQKYLLSIPPIMINNIISCSIGVLFSPVVLSIHQVIHGIFFISVGINITAIKNLFEISILNKLFSVLMYIFPPVEYLIALSVKPDLDSDTALVFIGWGLLYSILIIGFGYHLFNKKNIFTNEKGIFLTE